MTPFPTAISTPNAWTNSSIGGKAGLTHCALTTRLDRTIRHGRGGLRIENDRPIAGEIVQRAAIYERIYRERSGRVPMEAA